MAKVLIGRDLGGYTFDKVNKTITFSGFNCSLDGLLMVTDVTNNTIIYQFNDPAKGGSLVNNTLTLDYDTNVVAFSNNDNLQIFYWSEAPQGVTLSEIDSLITRRDLSILRRIENDTILGKNVVVTNTPLAVSLSSLNSVGSVGSLIYYGSQSDQYIPFTIHIQMRDNFNNFRKNTIQ
jgi:hypothetical protein